MGPKPWALLATLLLFAGCTQLDDARADLDDARADLDAAHQEAMDAKARYERVRSANVAFEETLRIVVVPMSNNTTLWFDVAAWRGNETAFPPENLTSLPPIRLQSAAWNITCDPLACTAAIAGDDINVTWADGAPGAVTLIGGNASCASGSIVSSYCVFPQLERLATIRVTAALGDVAG